jgi:hypothetical protein
VRAVVLDQTDTIHDLSAAAEASAQVLDDPTAAACALVARCWTLLGTPRQPELREAMERALSLPVAPEARILLHNLLVPLRPVAALQVADGRQLASVRAQVARWEAESYPQLVEAWLHMWDAAMALCCGRFEEVVRLTEDLSSSNWSVWRRQARFQLGIAGIERGYHTEVTTEVTSTLSATPDAIVLRALLASLHAAVGDCAGAADQVAVLRRQRPLDQLGWNAPFVLRQLAEVAARLDDTHLAADLLPVLVGYSGQMLVSSSAITVEGAADRAIGQLLLVLGRTDEAIERLAAARALEQSLGADALTVRTTYWHARALLARGAPDDQEIARRLLDEAAAGARRLGMTPLAHDIAAVARPSRSAT